MNAPSDRLELLLTRIAQMGVQRAESPDYALYAALKRDIEQLDLAPPEYTLAVQAAARATGV